MMYLPAKEEEAEKGNCSKDMPRLAIRKLHRRRPFMKTLVMW